MIYMEHLNLVVRDIPSQLSFYGAAFPHWRLRGGGEGKWSGKPRTWAHFGDQQQYLAFSDHGEGENRDNSGFSIGMAHLAFVVTDLDGLMTRLEKAGFKVDSIGDGGKYRRNVYYVDPSGYEVEFIEYFSDLPEHRNDYSE